MKLFVLRHAQALDRELALKQGLEDSLRPLVPKGRERTKKVAQVLAEYCQQEDLRIDMIIASPYARALQTAEVVAEKLKVKQIHKCAELVPSAPPQTFLQWLQLYAVQKRNILVVGHEPHLSLLVSWLLSGVTDPLLEIKKSALLEIEIENFETVGPRSGQLRWALPPKFLDLAIKTK